MQACAQCGEKPHACRFDATCDLRPAEGFRSPCLLKEQRRQQEEERAPVTALFTKPKTKRTRKERPKNVSQGARSAAG